MIPSFFGGGIFGVLRSLRKKSEIKSETFKALRKDENLLFDDKNDSVEYRKVSEKKLAEINERNIQEINDYDNGRLLKMTGIIVILCFIISIPLISNFNKVKAKSKEQSIIQNEFRQDLAKHKHLNKNSSFELYLEDGNKWLKREKYQYAKKMFHAALKIQPRNYECSLRYTEACVKTCVESQVDCERAAQLLEINKRKFGETKGLVQLVAIYKKLEK